ncbi:MAG: hypothetical protein IPP17_19730 [Bacteroidetes bacterium]|nr:hypothetical protein [Bacteroidota bacterium]
MKSHPIHAILLLLLLMFTACSQFSYREDYAGNFSFLTRRTVRNAGFPDTSNVSYNGIIREFGKDQVLIRFLVDDSLAPSLSESGTLTVNGLQNGATFIGAFTGTDSLYFESTFTNFSGDQIWFRVEGNR